MHTPGGHSASTTSKFPLRWASTCLPKSSTQTHELTAAALPSRRLASRRRHSPPLPRRQLLVIGRATASVALDILISIYHFTRRLLFTSGSILGSERQDLTCLTILTLQIQTISCHSRDLVS